VVWPFRGQKTVPSRFFPFLLAPVKRMWGLGQVRASETLFLEESTPASCSVSGQLFPEGLLQDLLKPRRDRAAEQRSEEGDIACGVDVLGIHPQLQPESSPV
jgi:hypothetical protein